MSVIRPLVAALEKKIVHIPLFVHTYSFPYRGVVRKEIALAEITDEDRVLNIGCGAIPFTAIHIARMSGAHVQALDKDRGAVRKARLCVRKMGLAHYISVHHGRGEHFCAAGFSAAVIALQAEPKNAILANLFACTNHRLRVIVREPRPTLKKQYDHLTTYEIPQAHCRQSLPTCERSLLFVK